MRNEFIHSIFRLKPSGIVTNAYVATRYIDLTNSNNVAISAVVTATEAGRTVYLKPQWGYRDETGTIIWGDEPIMDAGASGSGEYHQLPLSRVIDLTLDGTAPAYREVFVERFIRLRRYFRFLVKADTTTITGKLEIVAESMTQ